MPREYLRPPGLADAANQSGYGQAVRVDDVLYVSGQVARNPQGETIGIGDIEAQAGQVYENLKTVVEHAGGTMSDIVVTRTYLVDRAHRPAHGAVRRRYFPGPDYPCSTLLIVAGLADPNYLLEVEAVAHLRR